MIYNYKKLSYKSNKFKLSSSNGIQQFSYTVPVNEWKHYSFNIKNNNYLIMDY